MDSSYSLFSKNYGQLRSLAVGEIEWVKNIQLVHKENGNENKKADNV